ncbi:hypothetical protein L5515_000069 [Caenorhabditis briggsae]|uniref:Uncharacterized protein n=1 Tax=Caenorhabditis briggsae TaxID=6238 RepID=A0AAE9J1B4_CAEBR|nr:hypothetical protein L5515_000069 [Caenorhabditis briggsae]
MDFFSPPTITSDQRRFANPNFSHQGSSANREKKRSGSASGGMSLADHVDAIKKEMASVSGQLQTNKDALERSRNEVTQLQLSLQQVNDQQVQTDIQKAHETTERLKALAVKFLGTLSDPNQQSQLAGEFEQLIAKSGAASGGPQMAQMPQMMAAAMQPHMMMRNPMLNAMTQGSPRGVPGKGGVPNGGGINMMQQMQMQAMAAQVQAHAQAAMMHSQMFQGMPMMVPGMMGGMPPGMAGLPGMMPPNSMAAAMQQQYQQFQQLAAAAAASSVAVSTPSRNQSTSGAASRTRTPLTQSATNSPRPTTELTIKDEEPEQPETNGVAAAAAVTTAAASIKQEENSTVAVA